MSNKRGFWRTLGDMTLDALSPATESLSALGSKARELNANVKEGIVQNFKEKQEAGEAVSIHDVNNYIDNQIAKEQAFRRLYR